MTNRAYPLSRLLSYVLHPLLIPTYVTLALFMRPDLYTIVLPAAFRIWMLSVVLVFTLILPAAGLFILLKFKAITSLETNNRNERNIPLLIASTSFMVMLFSLKSVNIPPVFLYILYSAAFSLLAGLLINLVYKISLHTLGWGALTATLISISLRIGAPMLDFILVAIALAGLAGYARLKQNAHNPAQIYSGYVAGVLVIVVITLLS